MAKGIISINNHSSSGGGTLTLVHNGKHGMGGTTNGSSECSFTITEDGEYTVCGSGAQSNPDPWYMNTGFGLTINGTQPADVQTQSQDNGGTSSGVLISGVHARSATWVGTLHAGDVVKFRIWGSTYSGYGCCFTSFMQIYKVN